MIDFELTEAQSLLQRSARAALKEDCSTARVRELQRSDPGFDAALYRRNAALGWLGLLLPESLGGQDGAWVEAALLFEEFGRALLPGPYFAAISAAQVLAHAGGSQSTIAAVVSGETTIAPAFWERGAKSSLRHVETVARPAAEGYALSGEKRAVEFGHCVDQLLVTARLEGGAAPYGLFIVPRSAAGVSCVRTESINGEPRALVTLDGAVGTLAAPLGEADLDAVERLLLHLSVLRASELIGISQAALDLAAGYALQRVQYGRPIGAFQAIQHKLADAATRLELARWPVLYAGWQLAEGAPDDGSIAAAVVKAGEAAREVTAESVQTHGGLGVIEGSDVSLFYRAAKGRQLELGAPDQLRERVAAGLGL